MKPGVQLDLSRLLPDPDAPAEAPAPAKPGRKRPFRLTAPAQRERPGQQGITAHLNQAVPGGLAVHVANEGLWSFIKDPALRGRLRNAMLKDGFVPGFPDNVLFWPLPGPWRRALEAAGIEVPPLVALAAWFEVKRPGWTPEGDRRWREGDQPRTHARLRMSGVPGAVVRDEIEANEAAAAMGVPLRFRLRRGAGGAVLRIPAEEGGAERTPPT